MSIVKITKQEKLDRLLAKVTLRLGRKPTQQEILDLCLELGEDHFEELMDKINPGPRLDNEKVQRINNIRDKMAKIQWIKPSSEDFVNRDDADLYKKEDKVRGFSEHEILYRLHEY